MASPLAISILGPMSRCARYLGFMPTFGPCWVNLYGSTRDYGSDEHVDLCMGVVRIF